MSNPTPSTADRREQGKARRQALHRVDQCQLQSPKGRPDPVDLLVNAAKGRLDELLPIKWTRMNVSPFGFFRGAVPLMALDLAAQPASGITTQICGDAHVRNLGAFASPTGALVFDINDFDETIRGPWEWDLKRLATSLVLAGREAGDADSVCKDAVLAFVAEYRHSLGVSAEMTGLELARYTVHRHLEVGPVTAVLRKADRATPQNTLQKLTVERGGGHKLKEQKPLQFPVDDKTRREVLASLEAYKASMSHERRHFLELYRPLDVAFKVVGTGSVGTRCYVILCFGSGPDDPLFLQMKEEPPSAYAQYLKDAAACSHQGQRVVEGQRLMQAQSDIFLGWTRMEGRDYLVRQLADYKAAVSPADLKGTGLIEYARICGEVLGKGHARAGDACMLDGYCGHSDKLDNAIAKFAFAYAVQTEADYKLFAAAVKKGRLQTVEGVL